MLHLLTPLYRYDLVEKIYRTIPNNQDITWHLAKTNQRPKLVNNFIYTDARIQLYEIDCADNDIVTKRNILIDAVKDGYFFWLDDDTIFIEETYQTYQKYKALGFEGMIVGDAKYSTKEFINKAHYPSANPTYTFLDVSMAIAHHDVLAYVKYEYIPEHGGDCLFWSRCFAYFGVEKTVMTNQPISFYNFFSPIIRVRKQLSFLKIQFDIWNPYLAWCYFKLWSFRNIYRKFFGISRKNGAFKT